MKKVNTFHIGPQKSGTTWLYRALIEHEEVCTHSTDSINYFNIFYYEGLEWYLDHFKNCNKKILYDPTPGYIRDERTPERISRYNPDARIMFTARNPVERAFSHYWHEKKKDRFNFSFDEIFKNYDLFCNWVEPGFYASHLKRYLNYFPNDQIKVLFFDDLNSSPQEYFKDVCRFCNIDPEFSPSVLDKKINEAGYFKSHRQRIIDQRISVNPASEFLVRAKNKLFDSKHMEKYEQLDDTIKKQLHEVFYEDISELEKMTGRNLMHWKNEQ